MPYWFYDIIIIVNYYYIIEPYVYYNKNRDFQPFNIRFVHFSKTKKQNYAISMSTFHHQRVAFRGSPERDKKSFTASMDSKDRLTNVVHTARSSVHVN